MKKFIIVNAFLFGAVFFNNTNAQCNDTPQQSCYKATAGSFNVIQNDQFTLGQMAIVPGDFPQNAIFRTKLAPEKLNGGGLTIIVPDPNFVHITSHGSTSNYPSITLGNESFKNALVVNNGGYVTIGGAAGNRDQIAEYKLFVKDGIRTERVKVDIASANAWADYVFAKNYQLPTLEAVEKQIKENGHLKNVPSAEEVVANGIELAEMAKIQMEKIEELTLYLIQQNKEIQALKAKVLALEVKQ